MVVVSPGFFPPSAKGFTHYLVTLKPDADPHQWDKELAPTRHYSHALKGFRTQLTAEEYKRLKAHKQVVAIEPDTAIRPAVVSKGPAHCRLVPQSTFTDPEAYRAAFSPAATSTAGTTQTDAGKYVKPDGGDYTIVSLPLPSEIQSGVIRMGVPSFPLAQMDELDHQLNVNVAVLDTGVDTHFAGISCPRCYKAELNVVETVSFADTTPPSYLGFDWDGHGTHVAGIIGARNNGYGVVGVAPGVKLHNYQVMTPYSSTWGNFIAAMDYIVASQATNHIQAINASLEGVSIGGPYQAVSTVVQSIVNLGIVFVCAAGNDSCDIYGGGCSWTISQNGPTGPGSGNDLLPASIREALVVSAMDPNPTNSTYDTIASYSNGSWSAVAADPLPPDSPAVPVTSPGLAIDLAAPGTDITSLYPGGRGAIMSGTSMATAHVTGLVALYLAANPAPATPDANWVYSIRQTLINCGLPQSQWGVTNTFDPDGNPEPLAVVSESWIPQPNILGWSAAPEGVQLTFLTVPGYTYTMQYNDSWAKPAWSNLSTNENTLGSVTTNTVTDATANPEGRYYRLQRNPAP